MRQYYINSWANVVESMGTSLHKGLMEYDCIIRRDEYGNNAIDLPESKHWKNIIVNIFSKYNIGIAFFVITIFLMNKSYVLLGVWAIGAVINIIFKTSIYFKKNKKIHSLQNINNTDVMVLREGVERIVKSEELVKGDIVIFKKGSFVAADIRIISANGLVADERNITGELMYNHKNETKMYKEISKISEIENMLFRGSIIKEGFGTGIVVETGNDTILGRLYSSIKYNNSKSSLLSIAEGEMSKVQAILFIVAILLFIIIPGDSIKKAEVFTSSIFIVGTLLLPIMGYFYSKLTIKELEEKNIHTTNVSSIVNSSAVKVLFLNKIGSIAEEELVVKKFYTNDKYVEKINADFNEINLKRLLDIAYINSDIYSGHKDFNVDIYSEAYASFMKDKTINKVKLARNNPLKFRVPFDGDKKAVTTVVKTNRGYRANSRGALEEIVSRCTYILINGVERPITQGDKEKIKLSDLYFSREGLITEAFAYRSFNYEPTIEENIESNLVFVGLIALENPLVYGIKDHIEGLFDEGILPIIICDDNKIFAEIIGRKIGVVASSNEVTSGVELSYMSQDEFYKAVSKTRIYCRLTPKQKDIIISTYIKDGFKVAVEGQILGDVSVITRCNLGIVKGNAPTLLKKIGDIHSEESSIKVLLELRNYFKREKNIINYSSYIYMKILLSVLVAVFTYFIFENSMLFAPTTLVTFIIFTLAPILVLSLNGSKDVEDKKRSISLIGYCIVTIASVYLTKEYQEFSVYTIISMNSIIYMLTNTEIKLKGLNSSSVISIISTIMILLGCVIIYFITSSVPSLFLFITIGVFIIIYSIMIFFVKRWQQ